MPSFQPFNPLDRLRQRGPVRAQRPAKSGLTRKDFTDRLGMPENATNDQVLAELDARLEARASARRQSAQDAQYAALFGARTAQQTVTADDVLYSSLFPKGRS